MKPSYIIVAIMIILAIIIIAFILNSILFEDLKPLLQKDDTTNELKNTVYKNCLDLIKQYNIFKAENILEQANSIAEQYNSYILQYTELWEDNLPKGLVIQLPYLR